MLWRVAAGSLGTVVLLLPVLLDPWKWGFGWAAVGGAIVGVTVYESWTRWRLRTPGLLTGCWLTLVYWFVLTWDLPEQGLPAGVVSPQRRLVYVWPGVLFVAFLVAVIERNLKLEVFEEQDQQ